MLRPAYRTLRALRDSRFRGLSRFVQDLVEFKRRSKGELKLTNLNPILHNFTEEAGYTKGHYFHQDLWAAKKIFERNPREHLDVGSQIGGFVSHVLTFMPVTAIDIRPLEVSQWGLSFFQEDATEMKRFEDNSIDSLSSLHAVEHFGLGRYGDPVDPEAHIKAMRSFRRVLKPGGRLYFSVPIGQERVEFNAHRVLSPFTVLDAIALPLVSFCAVDDDGNFQADVEPENYSASRMACWLFEFTK